MPVAAATGRSPTLQSQLRKISAEVARETAGCDFAPIHVDQTFVEKSPHGTRIAHGPHSMATAIGLATHTGLFGERVLGLVDLNWDFSGAVRPGDTIRARIAVVLVRPTSKSGRSLAVYELDVLNQRDEIVRRGTMEVIVSDDIIG